MAKLPNKKRVTVYHQDSSSVHAWEEVLADGKDFIKVKISDMEHVYASSTDLFADDTILMDEYIEAQKSEPWYQRYEVEDVEVETCYRIENRTDGFLSTTYRFDRGTAMIYVANCILDGADSVNTVVMTRTTEMLDNLTVIKTEWADK